MTTVQRKIYAELKKITNYAVLILVQMFSATTSMFHLSMDKLTKDQVEFHYHLLHAIHSVL